MIGKTNERTQVHLIAGRGVHCRHAVFMAARVPAVHQRVILCFYDHHNCVHCVKKSADVSVAAVLMYIRR